VQVAVRTSPPGALAGWLPPRAYLPRPCAHDRIALHAAVFPRRTAVSPVSASGFALPTRVTIARIKLRQEPSDGEDEHTGRFQRRQHLRPARQVLVAAH
jgi:hypothetical protein